VSMDEFKHFGVVRGNKDGLSVIDCHICGHAHLYPVPTDTDEYYKNDLFYAEHSPSDWLDKELREYEDGLWDTAYKYQATILRTARFLVDVGAGLGTFVDYWSSSLYYSGFGLEPSSKARAKSPSPMSMYDVDYKSSIFKFLNDFPDENKIIRMALVLEHIPYPKRFLEDYVQYMSLGDKLMVIVPNDFSPLQKRVGGNWFISPVHCNYFTPDSLSGILQSLGLKIVHKSSTFPMELFILLGFDYRGNDVKGRKAHNFRMKFEKMFGVASFKLYKLLFDKYGWGREIIMVAEKQWLRKNNDAK
jgi:hypothetical protein